MPPDVVSLADDGLAAGIPPGIDRPVVAAAVLVVEGRGDLQQRRRRLRVSGQGWLPGCLCTGLYAVNTSGIMSIHPCRCIGVAPNPAQADDHRAKAAERYCAW